MYKNKGINDISSEKSHEIEDFLTEWMTNNKVPGMSVSVVEDGKVVYAKGFGSRDLEKNIPATKDTLYGIGSCTKSFTALGIMKLVERGELSLKDEITDYLPIDWENDIKIHDLLTHSSGMPSLGSALVRIERLSGIGDRGVPLSGLEDFYIHLANAKDEIAAEPGEEFFYFNSGYSLLGEIIEEVSGKSFSEFINDEILEPLEMENSTFDYEKEEDRDITTPYLVKEEGPEETPYPLGETDYPAGGLLSSVIELANYIIMNMNQGKFKGEEIIDSDLLEKMHSPHIEGNLGEYGYGWRIDEFEEEKFVQHGGSIGVGGGLLCFRNDIGVAIAANTVPTSSAAFEEVAKKIIKIIEDEMEEDLVSFQRKENMDMLTGNYKSYRDIVHIEIEKKYGLLRMKMKGESFDQKLILIPEKREIDDYKFYYLDGKGEKNPVRFEVNDDEIDLFFGRYRLHKVD